MRKHGACAARFPAMLPSLLSWTDAVSMVYSGGLKAPGRQEMPDDLVLDHQALASETRGRRSHSNRRDVASCAANTMRLGAVNMDESEKSITWVVVALMIAVAVLGWGFLAGSYVAAHAPSLTENSPDEIPQSNRPRPRNLKRQVQVQFIWNALEQLPNLPSVIAWHFSNRIWLPIVILVLEGLVVAGSFKMKSLEKQLAKPYRPKR